MTELEELKGTANETPYELVEKIIYGQKIQVKVYKSDTPKGEPYTGTVLNTFGEQS
jgi:hypothetical protein